MLLFVYDMELMVAWVLGDGLIWPCSVNGRNIEPWPWTERLLSARERVLCSGWFTWMILSAVHVRRSFGAEHKARRPLGRKP